MLNYLIFVNLTFLTHVNSFPSTGTDLQREGGHVQAMRIIKKGIQLENRPKKILDLPKRLVVLSQIQRFMWKSNLSKAFLLFHLIQGYI